MKKTLSNSLLNMFAKNLELPSTWSARGLLHARTHRASPRAVSLFPRVPWNFPCWNSRPDQAPRRRVHEAGRRDPAYRPTVRSWNRSGAGQEEQKPWLGVLCWISQLRRDEKLGIFDLDRYCHGEISSWAGADLHSPGRAHPIKRASAVRMESSACNLVWMPSLLV